MAASLGFAQQALRDVQGVIFVVRRVEIDYLAPARLDDRLTLTSQLIAATRTSLTVAQTIEADTLLARARGRLACLAAASGAGMTPFKPVRIPAPLLEKLSL